MSKNTLNTRGRRGKLKPLVRVVENANGKRRPLYVWEDGPGEGEVLVGIGSHLLKLKVGRKRKRRQKRKTTP